MFVLGAQIRVLRDRHRIAVSGAVAAAMAVADNLDQFWTVYDVRHRDLRGALADLAGELRRIERVLAARPAASAGPVATSAG